MQVQRRCCLNVFFPEHENENADKAFADASRLAGNVVLATSFEFDKDLNITGRIALSRK